MALTQVQTGMIADAAVSSAKVADAAITNAKLANGYPNLDFVSTDLGATSFPSNGTWVSLGGIAIPSAGKWRLWANLRLRWSNVGYYLTSGLFTSSSGGSGVINDSGASNQFRMLLERVSSQSASNIIASPEWIVDMPTGLTYPYTVYLQVFLSGTNDASGANYNDTNGIPTISAQKLASTSTSGTTPTCQ